MNATMRTLSILILTLLLSACAGGLGLQPPAVDTTRFTPMPTERRTINEPTVKVLPRPDGHEYCARITGHPITPTSRPMACAYWNTRRKECTIVTPMQTGYNYLGHELRHCFEGAFHG
jgi:hypothetical protein